MNPVIGLFGAFVFALGGAIVFYQLTNVLGMNRIVTQTSVNFVAFLIGFLVTGLGLWLIALTARPEIKQTPS